MGKVTTKGYPFPGKYKSEKLTYVALEPVDARPDHDLGKIKSAPDGSLPKLETIARKLAESAETKKRLHQNFRAPLEGIGMLVGQGGP